MNEPVEVWRLPEHDAGAGRRACGWTVGPDGELVVLLVPGEKPSGACGRTCPDPLPDAELVTVTPEGERRTALRGLAVDPDHLAPLPGGRLLVASYRADEEPGGWAPNAVVFGPDGEPEHELVLGDDIRTLVADRDGRIWMAFGDEGIYGDHPMAHPGLVGADPAGRMVWRPGPDELPGYPLEGLAGATEGRAVWLAWYPGSTASYLTRIDPAGRSVSRRSPVRLPLGFAVGGRQGIFLTHAGELVRCLLVGKEWKETGRRRLRLPGELDRERAYGRDGVLRFRSGDAWYRVAA
ncbi:hypothetical protein ABT263_12850 [Kitasatospora sp. NPDC001603]|uniref:hypothetical protein n=1 Tax=Kitasatospora sp. NPDC001603 TaxID=3154388 RepID=UPI00331E06CB